jgi:prolyl-tRNA synthetase
MRGREFYWKALYSFSKDQSQHDLFYEKAKQAYRDVFDRVGIGHATFLTFASGGTFSKYSHEFQTLSEAGEDTIYVDEEKGVAVNKEVFTDDVLSELGLEKKALQEKKAIEVGNIFSLGFKFSEPFELTYKNESGENIPVFMGSYGIGLTRLMGTIVEVLADERGIVWPESVAPFRVHLLLLNESAKSEAEKIYHDLSTQGIEVLFDDRLDVQAGEKFADADLLGIPHRVVISERSLASGGVEYKHRTEEKGAVLPFSDLLSKLHA